MTVEISNNQHSLNSPLLLSDDGVGFSGKMPLPWIQALRGDDSETMSLHSAPDVKQASLSDCFIPEKNQQEKESGDVGENWNDCHHHTPAWNKPLNAVYGVENLIGDTTSWPDLSECTRRPLRSSYYYTRMPDTLSTSQEIVSPRPPRRQTGSNRNQSSSVSNNASAAQQRSPRRNLVPPGSSFHVGGLRRHLPSSPQPPSPPPPYLTPFSFDTFHYVNPFYNNNCWGGRPIVNWPPGSNQYSYQNYSRRDMPRSHPRGDRYDREHDKYSSRNVLVPQQAYRGRGFNRPPPPPPPAYMISPLSYVPSMHVGMPFIVSGPPSPIPPHLPFYFTTPPPSLSLPALIVQQIDHYFGEKNLETDYHLKSLMDDQGWVPVTIVARFKRMQKLTDNIRLILDSLITGSTIVEVENEKLRCRNGWEKWVKKSDGVASNSSI